MTEPTPAGSAPSSNRTVMVILSYLGFLALIPLLVEKNDSEVQWHAKHGLVLFVTEIVLLIAWMILLSILQLIPVFGCVVGVISMLLWFVIVIGILVLHILCIVKGINGERFKVPYISAYADRF